MTGEFQLINESSIAVEPNTAIRPEDVSAPKKHRPGISPAGGV